MIKAKISILVTLVVVSFLACKKGEDSLEANLEASKTSSIKKGEPVDFSLPQSVTDTSINWSVSPNENTIISTSGKQASIRFAKKGTYTVTAKVGSFSKSIPVDVIDAMYYGDSIATTKFPFTTGETIKITVSRIDSGTASGLIFSAITSNSYNCLSNSLLSTSVTGTNSLVINYTGIAVPNGCSTGLAKASAFTYFYPITIGTNALSINFNGTIFTGTIIRAATSYTINWSYANGVVISPNTL